MLYYQSLQFLKAGLKIKNLKYLAKIPDIARIYQTIFGRHINNMTEYTWECNIYVCEDMLSCHLSYWLKIHAKFRKISCVLLVS